MSTDAPRAPLDRKAISAEISHYWRVSVVEITGSTQDDLYQRATTSDGVAKSVIAAEYQSAGRGRLDRTFIAPATSALTFSLYIEPKIEREEWSFLTLLTGISICEALTLVDPKIAIGLKWPNDLLIGEKKVGGIIAQATDKGVVIGIGINVHMSKEELPVENATSLSIEGFTNLNRNTILSAILNHIEVNFQVWELGQSFIEKYRQLSVTIDKDIEATLPGGLSIRSKAIGISESGALLLESGEAVTVGDVVHLR
jgi:BirA family biotin operon repressor/biotin-[acetyl-CoA-carboxylase] ligase